MAVQTFEGCVTKNIDVNKASLLEIVLEHIQTKFYWVCWQNKIPVALYDIHAVTTKKSCLSSHGELPSRYGCLSSLRNNVSLMQTRFAFKYFEQLLMK